MVRTAIQHHRAGRLADAETAYRAVLDAEPDQPEALLGLGRLAAQRGDGPEAERLLRRVLDLRPQTVAAWLVLGGVLSEAARWPEAEQAFRQAVALEPASALAQRQLARALERQQQFDAASRQYQVAAEVALAGVRVRQRLPFDNVYHCCTQKTASQWFRALFQDPTFHAHTGLVPRPYVQLGLDQASITEPFPAGTIATHLYVNHQTYADIPKPADYRTFFVLRDPRDAVVSWYFSALHSHIPVHPIPELRAGLSERDRSDGFCFLIDRLDAFGTFRAQRSWIEAAPDPRVAILRYEDLVADTAGFLNRLFAHLGMDVPRHVTLGLAANYGFARFSGGRQPGTEDPANHYRKGVAGDWRHHFDARIAAHFKARTGDLIEVLGYPSR